MKSHLLPVALCGSIALVSYILPVAALTPIEIQRIASQSTVRVTNCDLESGTIVHKNGNTYKVLAMSASVSGVNAGCKIVTPDNISHPVTDYKTFPAEINLGVVSFTSTKNYPVAKLIDNSDLVKAGETIYIAGFDSLIANGSIPLTLRQGIVISNSTIPQRDGYSLIYLNQQPYTFGGSIWNDRGELVAIDRVQIFTKLGNGRLQDIALIRRNNDDIRINTEFDSAITVDTFTKFASTVGIGSDRFPLSNSRPVDEAIANAVKKVASRDEQGALADVNRAVAIDPQNFGLHYLRGRLQPSRNKQEAIEDFNRAIALNPNFGIVYAYRGGLKLGLDDNKGAIADFDKAIALMPRLGRIYYNRGKAKLATGDNRGAIEDYSRYIATLPKLKTKLALGETQADIREYNQQTSGFYIPPYTERAEAKVRLGDNKGAVEDYNQVIAFISFKPEGVLYAWEITDIYYKRGLAKSKLGNKKSAILDLRIAAKQFKQQQETRRYQAVMADIKRLGF